jgi:hypothetical protein
VANSIRLIAEQTASNISTDYIYPPYINIYHLRVVSHQDAMAATQTAMPWHPAARKDARQAASFDASRANSSFKMDVEEIIAVITYVHHRKQKLKK